jgi:hypothetical protein
VCVCVCVCVCVRVCVCARVLCFKVLIMQAPVEASITEQFITI